MKFFLPSNLTRAFPPHGVLAKMLQLVRQLKDSEQNHGCGMVRHGGGEVPIRALKAGKL